MYMQSMQCIYAACMAVILTSYRHGIYVVLEFRERVIPGQQNPNMHLLAIVNNRICWVFVQPAALLVGWLAVERKRHFLCLSIQAGKDENDDDDGATLQ